MEEIHRDIAEVKRLFRKQLDRTNVILLVEFVLIWYLFSQGKFSLFLGILSVFLWIYLAIQLYSFFTGKFIGTKSSEILQGFLKDYYGDKRWRQKKITEIVVIGIFSVLFTVLFFVIDFAIDFELIYLIVGFIVYWIVFNIGEVIKINKYFT